MPFMCLVHLVWTPTSLHTCTLVPPRAASGQRSAVRLSSVTRLEPPTHEQRWWWWWWRGMVEESGVEILPLYLFLPFILFHPDSRAPA
jgi:hypothetical protein